jgi:sugar transferase (PEP-CTERM/EpsH1 system associated)
LNKKQGKDWMHYVRYWRALRAFKPDLVQSYNIGTLDLVPMSKLAGVRRIIHAEHGRDSTDPQGNNPKYLRLRRWLAPLITRYVAVSPDLQRWLIDRVGIRPSGVVHIPNGIDVAKFKVAHGRRGPRKLLGDFAPPGTMLVGNVARLDKVKDHACLILAFKILCDQPGQTHDHCRLVIAGEGPQRGALEPQIAQLGLTEKVRLLGDRDDVPNLLAECDVFVLSSIAEGMPLTLLEAMAAGLPVITTNVGGTASVVVAGKTGILLPPSDPQKLADAIGVYVNDEKLRHQHGEAGYAHVVARFSLDKMMCAYETLYDQLLGRGIAPRARGMSGLTDREVR